MSHFTDNNTDFIFQDTITTLLNEQEQEDKRTRDTSGIQTIMDKPRLNKPYGDSHQDKNPEHIRWYIQNINGINPEYDWMEWRTQLQFLKESKVDGFSFTETNIRWTPEQNQKARTWGRRWFKQFRFQTSSSNNPTTRKSYQPGGTCTGIINQLAGNVTTQGCDPSGMGRWSYFSIEGKLVCDATKKDVHQKIHIISAYLVSQKDSANPGHETAFMQQKRILTLSGDSNPKPRKKGFLDLTAQIQAMQADKADVLLCTDANADILDPDFQTMILTTGLVDLMAQRLGPDLPETYIRGQKTVDHAYGSKRLAKTVEGAGYLAYNDGILADHRGFFLDLNRQKLLGQDQNVVTREERALTTNNKQGAAQYQLIASKGIISKNIPQRLKDVEQQSFNGFSPEVIQVLEEIDQELHQILLDAKTKIASYSHVPWSPQLHYAYQVWKYWKIILSYFKTKRIPGNRVKRLLQQWEHDYKVFQGDRTKTISQQLRQARKELNYRRINSTELRLEYMEILAIKYELLDEPNKAKIIKRIMKAEEQSRMYRTLKRYLKPPRQSLNYVEVPVDPNEDPNTATNWKKIFNKAELEAILHE
jgi:hypothetical protein